MSHFEQAYCMGNVTTGSKKHDMIVYGTIMDVVDDAKVYYIAASQPDYKYSFTGSALPFSDSLQAFQNTPNKGALDLSGGSFTVKLLVPNSYYVGLGTVLIPPTLFLYYLSHGEKKTLQIKLFEGVPYRALAYPSSMRGPTFYETHLPIRTQEQILKGGGFPAENNEALDFWGLKPAC
jgi:hypothetical protein